MNRTAHTHFGRGGELWFIVAREKRAEKRAEESRGEKITTEHRAQRTENREQRTENREQD